MAGQTPDLSDYRAVRHYLYGLKHHGAKYGIDRMQLLARELGHPERSFPVIHVAGTNGKGSVCAMLEAMYRANGYKTGMYTSPHLVRQGERIQVNRRLLGEEEIVRYTRELQVHATRLGEIDPDDHPSFFEFMTAMAFLQFQREEVDVGLIETGLGGRLDATNIVEPEASVITSISLDHVEILGETEEKIAREKAGIVKPGRPVVLGHLSPAAEGVIRAVAAERGSPVAGLRERFGETLKGYPETSLAGSFQRWNAGTALLTAEILQRRLPLDLERARAALLTVDWPGRWQRVPLADRTLILDASHNPEGCRMLEENLGQLFRTTGRKPVILAGTLGEFRAQALMPALARHARELVLLVPHQPRACSFDELERWIPDDFAGPVRRALVKEVFPSPGSCLAGEPGDVLVATGSIYLLGEIADQLFHQVPVGDGFLQDAVLPGTMTSGTAPRPPGP